MPHISACDGVSAQDSRITQQKPFKQGFCIWKGLELTEATGDVLFGELVTWVGEDLGGFANLDQLA